MIFQIHVIPTLVRMEDPALLLETLSSVNALVEHPETHVKSVSR